MYSVFGGFAIKNGLRQDYSMKIQIHTFPPNFRRLSHASDHLLHSYSHYRFELSAEFINNGRII